MADTGSSTCSSKGVDNPLSIGAKSPTGRARWDFIPTGIFFFSGRIFFCPVGILTGGPPERYRKIIISYRNSPVGNYFSPEGSGRNIYTPRGIF